MFNLFSKSDPKDRMSAISLDELTQALEREERAVVDVREPHEYASGQNRTLGTREQMAATGGERTLLHLISAPRNPPTSVASICGEKSWMPHSAR